MGRTIGYLRVSRGDQCPDRQIDGLSAVCDELHLEQGVSATAKKRPVFDATIRGLQPGDTLVVWDLDRAFRSTVDAITTAKALNARGIHLRIVTLHVDTSTPAGRLVYAMLAAAAEYEREVLIERTRQGLAAARRRGVRLGRPRKLSSNDVLKAQKQLRSSSETLCSVASTFGCSRHTLSRALRSTA